MRTGIHARAVCMCVLQLLGSLFLGSFVFFKSRRPSHPWFLTIFPIMDVETPPNEAAAVAPPFTADQLQWIDQLITSRQGQTATGSGASSPATSGPSVPTSAAPVLSTTASQSGKNSGPGGFGAHLVNS